MRGLLLVLAVLAALPPGAASTGDPYCDSTSGAPALHTTRIDVADGTFYLDQETIVDGIWSGVIVGLWQETNLEPGLQRGGYDEIFSNMVPDGGEALCWETGWYELPDQLVVEMWAP